ncbi:hypothetical protein F5883DRAFT_434545 [Diaporthe sp. PMI_573]|nr:hypothetical protein F5883DRAFT_434545 [Diaporthaceae sp. PMI_573]
MSFNPKVQNQAQQAAPDEIPLKPPPQNPHREQKARGGSRAESINSTVERRKHWRYPPEFWDRLPTISLTRSALEELDRRNRGSNRPYFPSPPTTPAHDPTLKETKTLLQFARHGGPCLCDLRGYQPAAGTMRPFLKSLPTQSINPTKATTQRPISSTHDANFEQHLAANNIHPIWRSQKPDLVTVFEALPARRQSLSPSYLSADVFETFLKSNLRARNEADIVADVVPTILGTQDANWPIARNTLFNHLEPLTDDTIPSAKPDFSYGALSEQLHPAVCTKLGRFIAPGPDVPLVPNFFLEVKGPKGSAAVKTVQACYDGAIGARAMHELQNYGQEEPVYDGKSYAFSSTYHDGTLKLYAHHLTAPTTRGGRPEYHMTQLRTFGLTDTPGPFVQGVTAFRNLRDLAKQHRDTFIQDANFRYQQGAAAAEETTRGGRPEYHMTQLGAWATTGNVQSFIAGVTAFRNLRDLAKQHRDTFIQDANFRYQQGAAAAEEGATATTQGSRAGIKRRRNSQIPSQAPSAKRKRVDTDEN